METLAIWRRFASKPGGKWAFSRLLCLKAPYFGSIHPRFEELRPGYCRIAIRKRRAVLNHIGTVHAIAMCNMAELAGGTMTEVSIPATHRWIPKGMSVEYLKKAATDLVALATPESTPDWSGPGDYKVNVTVSDRSNEPVLRATITMWVTPRKSTAG
jgi:acyl-coenzyme A thioesterase PaaI-like protein